MADRRQTLADASMAAARTHARLKLPSDRPIDIFSIVQQLGIWLNDYEFDSALAWVRDYRSKQTS